MYRIAISIVKSNEAAEDAIQEATLKAYENMKKLREPVFFRSWLIRILMNQCYQILRERKRVVHLDDWNSSKQSVMLSSNLELQEVLQELPEDYRIVIILFYLEQWKMKEITEATGLSLGTVKSRLHRARKALIPLLTDERKGCR
nr:sigma-70 family RNA polymerase sigma factor [Evansella tamaricis]